MFDPRSRGSFCTKKFYFRQLGKTTWQGHFGAQHYQQPFRWKALNQMDRLTAKYVCHRIHGLPFEDNPQENARQLEILKGDVSEVSKELDLPAVNLEHYGCPKFEKLNTISIIRDCGHHRFKKHCAMVKSHAFWQWANMPEEDMDTEFCL